MTATTTFVQARIDNATPSVMHVPNKRTADTLAKSERGEEIHHAKDVDGLFNQLGILCGCQIVTGNVKCSTNDNFKLAYLMQNGRAELRICITARSSIQRD